MPEEARQTQGLAEPTSQEMNGEAPQDELSTQSTVDIAPKMMGDVQFPEDPLSDIEGAADLPEDQQKGLRDAILRKFNQVDETLKRTAERERQYMEALERLQQPPKQPSGDETPNYEGMNPQQIVEDIARRVSREVMEQSLKEGGFGEAKQKIDATVRQLQLLEAQQHYPDLPRYKDQLIQMGEIFERELGKERADKFSVTDMMDLIKAREMRARTRTQKPRTVPSQPKPSSASVARSGVTPSAVEPSKEPTSLEEAFELAEKQHGPYNPAKHP